MVIKKLFILTLALSAGFSNLAYVSAKPECSHMSEQSIGQPACHKEVAEAPSPSSCCASGACECSVKEKSNAQTLPEQTAVRIDRPQAVLLTNFSEAVLPARQPLINHAFESPPKQPPLYELFSVYRI